MSNPRFIPNVDGDPVLIFEENGIIQTRQPIALFECEYCNGKGIVEMDNNGPIGACPVCKGIGYKEKTSCPQ